MVLIDELVFYFLFTGSSARAERTIGCIVPQNNDAFTLFQTDHACHARKVPLLLFPELHRLQAARYAHEGTTAPWQWAVLPVRLGLPQMQALHRGLAANAFLVTRAIPIHGTFLKGNTNPRGR